MDTLNYNKPRLSVEEQLDVLRNRGLEIDDPDKAHNVLENNSYFRLAGYWRMMEKDKVTHEFRKGSKFSTIVDYYNFDRELRVMLFSAIQTIEITVRTKMINMFTSGSFWFMDRDTAKNMTYFQENLASIEKEVTHSHERFIAEHFQKYAVPELPPVWKTLEVISFGTMSKLFSNYKCSGDKMAVAHEFGLKHYNILTNWLGCLTVLRNCCAHHNQIFNRIFFCKPTMPQNMPNRWISNFNFHEKSLYPIVCQVAYLLNAINESATFVEDFKQLLSKYPSVNTYMMGFPQKWEKENFWKKYLVI